MSQADHPLADLYPRSESPARFVPGPGYRTPSRRSRSARWFIGLTVALNAVSILLLGLQRALLNRGPGLISLAEWHRSVVRVQAAADFELLAFIVALVLFLRWLHLSYCNLRALGTQGMRFTPGWAVGYWFVPVLNIIILFTKLPGWVTEAKQRAGSRNPQSAGPIMYFLLAPYFLTKDMNEVWDPTGAS